MDRSMNEPYRDSPNAATLGPNKKHCHACANILDVRAELCPACGVRQPVIAAMAVVQGPMTMQGQFPAARSRKDKTTAGVFALLLGGIGAHRFYLGQTGIGFLYLLFCWTLLPSLFSFIEGILFLTMSEHTFAERYPG
jgi:TM2 domain-containing membrane protein YozV